MRENKNTDSELTHTPIGYFRYFHKSMGNKLLWNIVLAILLGLFDGVGLALFIPLLQFVNDPKSVASGDAMGGMRFVLESFQSVGIPLNLFSVLLLILVIFSIKGLLTYILSMEQVDLRQKYMVKLRLGQIEDLNRLSYQGFLKLDAGRIQNVITAEIGRNLQAMVQFLVSIKMAVILISYVLLAFLANWQFAILIIIGGALSNLIFKRINNKVKSTSILISKRNGLFSGYIIQCIHTFKYLKSTDYFKFYANKLKSVISDIEKFNRVIGKNQAITVSAREPIIMLIVVGVILLQVYLFGSNLGSIILSLLLFYRALNGLLGLQNSWQSFMQSVGALDSISEMTELMRKEKEDLMPNLCPEFKDALKLDQIDFAYGDKVVLNNVSLTIKKYEAVAFVGESGSGKSTLANIIITLLKPKNGRILLDDCPISDFNSDSFRSKIGYITQEPIIYADTIFNNITFWAEKTPENVERFWQVLRQVALEGFVKGSRNIEDTELGDNGVKISGGQKQRISIARELYKNIEILIMDEATSALDSETESLIQDSINQLRGKYTLIVIAHRLSTIKNADCIYLLENGQISANGNFESLVTQSKKFKNMVNLQNLILE